IGVEQQHPAQGRVRHRHMDVVRGVRMEPPGRPDRGQLVSFQLLPDGVVDHSSSSKSSNSMSCLNQMSFTTYSVFDWCCEKGKLMANPTSGATGSEFFPDLTTSARLRG